jgi:hypothetical protein
VRLDLKQKGWYHGDRFLQTLGCTIALHSLHPLTASKGKETISQVREQLKGV